MKYTTVSLSEDVMNKIKRYMKSHGGEYMSAGEVIRDAIREKLERDK